MRRKDHPLHKTWLHLRERCNNPNCPDYHYYGGRGITVCDRWDDFWLFVEDMGERPPGLTLDRINNDGNYEPSNCRWATRSQQIFNQRKGNRRKLIRKFILPGTIRKDKRRWRLFVDLMGRNTAHSFETEEDAIDYQSQLAYEREFHRMLGL